MLEQLEQKGKFGKLHHFTIMQPLKPGKDNAYYIMISKVLDNI